MEEHLLSIIIPVYNGEKYLRRCIESVLSQPAGINWELILVNDGSTDGTDEICKKYAETHENIHYVVQENTGGYSARLRGIDIAQGDWLAFLDTDDTFTKDAFSFIEGVLDENVEIVVFDFNNVISENVERRKYLKNEGIYLREEIEQCLHLCSDKLISASGRDSSGMLFGNVWSKVYRRKLLDYEEHEDLRDVFLTEDRIFFAEILSRADKIMYISHPIYNYFENPNSVTHTIEKRDANKIIHNFELYLEYILRHVDFQNPDYPQMLTQERLFTCKMCLWNRAISREDAEKIFAFCHKLMTDLPVSPKFSELGWMNYLLYFCLKHNWKHILWLLVWIRKRLWSSAAK